MKRILLLTLLFSSLSFGQNQYNSNDLNVTKADLELKAFEQDTTANAVVLYELGDAYIDDSSFDLVFKYKKKIKIINREGFNEANVRLRLYNSGNKKEKVEKITATTTNLENGKTTTVKLEKSQIFTEKSDDNNTYVKFTLPNIKEGSVITYSYTLKTPYIYKYQPWYFQEDIPKLYSEYNTSIPANYDYNIKLVGELKLKSFDKKLKRDCVIAGNGGTADCTISAYKMENIPAFVEEDYMRAANNFTSRIEYELKTVKGFDGTVKNISKTWEIADKEFRLDEDFGKQLKKKNLVGKLIPETELSQLNKLEKAQYIYNFVRDQYTWNKKNRIFKDISVKDIIKEKSGNVAEVNLLLYNLLVANGFSVNPILLSTRDNGVVTKLYPVISEFNYIILKLNLDDKDYLLDATDKEMVFGQIPFRCLNDYGREMDFKNGSKWIDINAQTSSSVYQKLTINVNDDFTFSAKLNIKNQGYKALRVKKAYNKNNVEYVKKYQDKFPDFVFEEIIIDDNEDELKINEELNFTGDLNYIGDKIYLDPFILKVFKDNPLKLKERNYPVDFGYKDSFIYSITVNFSENFEITEINEDKTEQLEGSSALSILKTSSEEGVAQFYFRINFYKESYPSIYYEQLKAFFANLVDIQNNSLLVLKKKN